MSITKAHLNEENYNTWFRDQVQEALDSAKPSKPHAEVIQRLRASIDD
jgi:hypothetical protein